MVGRGGGVRTGVAWKNDRVGPEQHCALAKMAAIACHPTYDTFSSLLTEVRKWKE